MMLKDKVVVIYGAGGAIGGAVASAFAKQGASLYLTGRSLPAVEKLAKDIVLAGGVAEAAAVDALNEQAIREHLQTLMDKTGRLDISFNAIGIGHANIIGVPLTDIELEYFLSPILNYTKSYFLTARLAAEHMMPRQSGVIMTVTALPARTGTRLNGGYGAAMAAKEALTRDLSAELAPSGIRVLGLRPHAMPETPTMHSVFEKKALGIGYDQFTATLAATTHPRRVMKLKELAEVAVFMASDQASGMTGTTVNLTMGSLDD